MDARPINRNQMGDGFAYDVLAEFIGSADNQKEWIFKGAIAYGETSAWVGPPGSLKSALMADMSVSIAYGLDWHGKRFKRNEHVQLGVIYFALERADLVRRRIEAQITRLGLSIDQRNIIVVPATIDLLDARNVAKVANTIKNAEWFTEAMIAVVIFDTHAKLIAAGGGDEDKAKDQGRLFTNLERLKELTGRPHIALVGHTGKDETRGARGSNAFYGDVDLMVTISGTEVKTASVVKANDAPEGPLFSFKSIVHEFGLDEDGDPITVNIVSPEDVTAEPSRRASKWTRGLKLVHEAIAEAILSNGRDHLVCGTGPSVKAVAVQQARAIHNQRYVSNGEGERFEAERKAWNRNFKQARDLNLIGGELREGLELIWLAQ